jgi:hypothetical protein
LARKAERETDMTISSVGGAAQSYLSQLYSAQQAQAASAVSVDVPAADSAFMPASTVGASGSNSLTGTSSSNLDSQTLQALLDLTQQDPAAPSQQSGQTSQASGAHHHGRHHHGGGEATAPTPASSTSATTTASAGTADATTEASDADASLEEALLAA